MYTPRAELKAGILVLVAASAFLFFLYRASGSRLPWAKGPKIHLRFEQGFAAPVVGDPVYMLGVKIGQVTSVRQETEVRGAPGPDGRTIPLTDADRARLKLRSDQPGVLREIYVRAVAELFDRDQPIPRGTRGQMVVTLTGARELSLLPGPSLENLTPEQTRDEPIVTSAAGDIAQIQAAIEDVARKIGTVADNANLVLADVRGVIADLGEKVRAIELAEIQGNLTAASKDLRETLAVARRRVDEVLARVVEAAEGAKAVALDADAGVQAVVADLREMLAHLKSASAEVDAIVRRASPRVDEILENVASAARAAEESMRGFGGVGPRLDALVAGLGPKVEAIVDRFLQTAHNLADTSEDVRARPWLLLNKPDDKEIAFENLRSASTNVVRTQAAVLESLRVLHAMQESLRTTALTPEERAEREKALKALEARLEADQRRYDEAASTFLGLLRSGAVQAPR